MKILALIVLSVTVLQGQWRLRNASGEKWMDVNVPTTVLAAHVHAGLQPDPRLGMNHRLIPDISDAPELWAGPFVYRTEFRLDAAQRASKRVFLRLNGINYRADVVLNGEKIADRDSVVGMFRRFTFDVTEQIRRKGNNALEITVYQVDHPGKCLPGKQETVFGPKRGSARDIWRDETLKLSGGWDCAPVVPDRNVGLTQPVELICTGDVTLEDPFVESRFPDGDTTVALMSLKTVLRNHSGRPVGGILNFRVGESETSLKLKLLPGDNAVEIPSLRLEKPALWWPNGYGPHPLYKVNVSFRCNGGVSDERNFETGIREIRSAVEYKHGEPARVFYVNGRRIFCTGGWLQPDILLEDTAESFERQAQLLADAGFNLVSSEDMPAPPQHFYDALNRHGLLYWHVFHQCWRTYPGTASEHNPDDHELAEKHVRDEILRYRNNPCIAAWVGVVEVMPDEDLYRRTKAAVEELDPGRTWIPTTSVDWDVDALTPWLKAELPTGTTDAGAPDYGWEPSEVYFRKVKELYLQTFRNELGMPAVPVWSSLKRIISTAEKSYDPADPLFPLDKEWAEHGAWGGNNFCFRAYDNAIRTFYGEPVSVRDYVRKAQMVSAEGLRAVWEAARHRMWDITSGVMLWKLNSCWGDVCWQLYDCFLEPNAAYWFSKKALEPLHVQMNADTRTLAVVNSTRSVFDGSVRVRLLGLDGSVLHEDSRKVSVNADSYGEFGEIPVPKLLAGEYFIRLELYSGEGACVSDNLYWRYAQHPSYWSLMHLPTVELGRNVQWQKSGSLWKATVTLENRSGTVSFFRHLQLADAVSGEVLPYAKWSDNFVTLFPGETRVLEVEVESVSEREPVLIIE